GIASALAGGAMSKLFGGGQKAASGGIQGDVLATDNNTVGMGDAGIKSAIQGSNVPNPDEAVPSFVSGAMAKAGKGLLEDRKSGSAGMPRSEERFSRNAETDVVCRLLLERNKRGKRPGVRPVPTPTKYGDDIQLKASTAPRRRVPPTALTRDEHMNRSPCT